MKKIQFLIVLAMVLFFTQAKAADPETPSFLPQYFAPAFTINGHVFKMINHSEKEGVEQFLYFTDDKSLTLLVENIRCDRPRATAIFRNVIINLNDRMKSKAGDFLEINSNDICAKVREDGKDKTVFVYVVPTAVQIWTYVEKSGENRKMESQFKIIKSFINRQRYSEAKGENVAMGLWGDAIYEYAQELLHKKNYKEAVEVLGQIIATSPYNFKAHIDFIENTADLKAAVNSAKVILKISESPELTIRAAKFLDKKIAFFDSIPFLDKYEMGLQVILIPLLPCDVSLLDEVSETYQKITSIPVKIRRIKESWQWGLPDRIPFERVAQKTLVELKGEDVIFTGYDKEKYIEEIRKAAETKDALVKYYTNKLTSRIKEGEGQYYADTYLNRFLTIIEKYRSFDKNTIYVGITGANIYSGDNNYLFSLYAETGNKFRGSILSYYMMQASNLSEDYESRKRLVERIAKELVPASLKSVNIPRSTDPTCPYSYSSGVARLDEKTLVLSEEVKNAIEKLKSK
ncbi:MAG: hypothetical protein QMD11_10700, partial [Smithella sp.]|nr:hypothetical protein [Smithella sp.]